MKLAGGAGSGQGILQDYWNPQVGCIFKGLHNTRLLDFLGSVFTQNTLLGPLNITFPLELWVYMCICIYLYVYIFKNILM